MVYHLTSVKWFHVTVTVLPYPETDGDSVATVIYQAYSTVGLLCKQVMTEELVLVSDYCDQTTTCKGIVTCTFQSVPPELPTSASIVTYRSETQLDGSTVVMSFDG